jgi:hypothetical protein
MLPERDRQKNGVGFEGFLQRLRNDPRTDRTRPRRQRLGGSPAGDDDFDALAGEHGGEGLTHCAETDNCVTHGSSSTCIGVDCADPHRLWLYFVEDLPR